MTQVTMQPLEPCWALGPAIRGPEALGWKGLVSGYALTTLRTPIVLVGVHQEICHWCKSMQIIQKLHGKWKPIRFSGLLDISHQFFSTYPIAVYLRIHPVLWDIWPLECAATAVALDVHPGQPPAERLLFSVLFSGRSSSSEWGKSSIKMCKTRRQSR